AAAALVDGPFDVVVANLWADDLLAAAYDLARLTAPGGEVVCSGMRLWQAYHVRNVLETAGLRTCAVRAAAGWGGLLFERPRDAEQCERMVAAAVETWGGLDILVNNAGANFLAPALQMSPNGWRTIMDIVLTGTFFASQAAARALIERGGGSIVMNSGANGVS